jgi:carboxypeptidase family protein
MTRALVATAWLLLGLSGALRAQGSTRGHVRGTVTDSAGQGLANTELLLHDLRLTTRTREDGGFEFPPIARGVYVITARRIGYAPVSWSFRLDDTVSLQLRLYRTVATLPQVVINGETRVSNPKLVGFYDRLRNSGASRSTFITREDIEKRHPWLTSDLVRDKGTRATGCLGGRIYVDGVSMPAGSSFDPPRGKRRTVPDPRTPIDIIPPADIEAMEIYSSAATVPSEYNATALPGTPVGCVILVWTR